MENTGINTKFRFDHNRKVRNFMCGIIGYTGNKQVKDIVLDALTLLEYRGYDSAGMAVSVPEKPTKIIKCAGRVTDLRKLCESNEIEGTCGIGHTRWATHGGVSDENAHPHKSGKITVIHNGIIENYSELTRKYDLQDKLRSQTDTEVVAAVLAHHFTGDPFMAIVKTVSEIKGTFSLGILFEDNPDTIYAVRNVSPIVAAFCDTGALLASDVTALCKYTKEYFVLPELHVAELKPHKITVYDLNGKEVAPEYITMDWDVTQSEKNGYPFFMEKEIMEQPEAIRKTIMPRIRNNLPSFEADGIPDSLFTESKRICVVACGTAMHSGLVGKSLIQSMINIHVDVVLASEFMYTNPVIDEDTLVIAVSQSGETIDTLEALKFARKKGAKRLAIVNVKGSTITRECEQVIYTYAGPEIAVASTKAYTTQLAAFYLIACRMAYLKGTFDEEKAESFMRELQKVPAMMEKVLDRRDIIHKIARKLVNARDLFMIGRGLDYSTLLEGSLKLKEVSYIHSEAYASGELKHGTIALITEETPVIALVTQACIVLKEVSNIREVQARGARVFLLIKEEYASSVTDKFEESFTLPDMEDDFMVMPASVALQLIAYYVSLDKGLDVDKPRNLAKVVTVE